MQHRLYGLRGRAYVSEFKRILAEDGDRLRQRFEEIRTEKGKFTPPDLGRLCVEFKLPVTALDAYLSHVTNGEYPSGTWERLRDRGCTAKQIGVIWT